jgi:hypothetical protein
MSDKPEPTVKLTPDFKAGETIKCKSTGEEFKILKIHAKGALECEGRAGLMPKEAAEKILP